MVAASTPATAELLSEFLSLAKVDSIRIGVNVSPLAQETFNILSKTYVTQKFFYCNCTRMPCRWNGDGAILVFNDVIVRSPYTADNVFGPPQAQPAVERVRRVVVSDKSLVYLLFSVEHRERTI